MLDRRCHQFLLIGKEEPNPSIRAGSPGVIAEDSQIFAQLDDMDESHCAAKLHVTLNDREILGKLAAYQSLAKNTTIVLHRITARSEAVTSEILHETHLTGLQASFLSYLRTCRPR